MRYLAVIALVLAQMSPAAAQLRTIPADAKRGEVRHLTDMLVELDGKQRRLSAGAQIRDADNRLVVPSSLVQKREVKYLVDAQGLLHRVWILTPQEKAAKK